MNDDWFQTRVSSPAMFAGARTVMFGGCGGCLVIALPRILGVRLAVAFGFTMVAMDSWVFLRGALLIWEANERSRKYCLLGS